MTQELYTLKSVILLTETEKAVRVEDQEGELLWLPLSQINKIVRYPERMVDIVMTAWIAKQKGLI